MKRIFYCMLATVFVIAAAFIGYGVYLNKSGESNIAARLADNQLHLRCVVATKREIQPAFQISNVALQDDTTSDTVSQIEGTIVEAYVHKNQMVQAGDPLFRIVNTKLPMEKAKAVNALAKVQAQAEQAELSFQRYEKLLELNATSLEKYEEAKANYKATAAAVSEAQAQVDLVNVMQDETIVKATTSGSITLTYKRVGDYVQNGTPLCLIGNFSRLWFACNIPDSSARAMLSGMDSKTTFSAYFNWSDVSKVYETEYKSGNQGKEQEFPLTLQGVYPSMDQPASMRRVVWYVDNSTAVLEPRSYGNVFIYNNNKRKLFAIPRKALRDDSNNEVFIINNGILELRKVVCGSVGYDYAEIISGLSEGEVVVISDDEGLKPGMKAEAILEDM